MTAGRETSASIEGSEVLGLAAAADDKYAALAKVRLPIEEVIVRF